MNRFEGDGEINGKQRRKKRNITMGIKKCR